MSKYIVTDTQLSTVAGAIRTATGTSASLSWPIGYISAVGSISAASVSDDPNKQKLVMRTITGFYENSTVTAIGAYAFYDCGVLSSVSFPNCTIVSFSAFQNCSKLTSVSMPLCEKIGSYAFNKCASLTNASFPLCSQIEISAFYSCAKMESAYFPSLTYISNYAFGLCSSLEGVSFPMCTYVGTFAFSKCSALSYVYLPLCSSIGGCAFTFCPSLTEISMPNLVGAAYSAFASCSSLSKIFFPKLSSIGASAFMYCTALRSVYLPMCSSYGTSAFYGCLSIEYINIPFTNTLDHTFQNVHGLKTLILDNRYALQGQIKGSAFSFCYNLTSLYLLASNKYSLQDSTAFSSTPIGGYTESTGGVTGSIFVPESLYSYYISSTNWVYYSSRFVSLSSAAIYSLYSCVVDMSEVTTGKDQSELLTASMYYLCNPVYGMSYHASIAYNRTNRGGITYTINGNFTWSGFGSTTITLSATSGQSGYAFLGSSKVTFDLPGCYSDTAGDQFTILITPIT